MSLAMTRSFIAVISGRVGFALFHEACARVEAVEVFAQPLDAAVEILGFGARHQVAALRAPGIRPRCAHRYVRRAGRSR